MIYKKKDRNDLSNYRAICLLCHAYKLLSAVIARRLHLELEPILPDSQAGFRPARGTRDNVCILKWATSMLLREGRQAVVTFIDYTAAFDTESQLFLDEALHSADVPVKLRRVIQSIFSAASGRIRIRNPDGTTDISEPFDISRGVLQGDLFSPVAFIVGLWRTFVLHDPPNAGVRVGKPPYEVDIVGLEYAEGGRRATRRRSTAGISPRDRAIDRVKERRGNGYIHPEDEGYAHTQEGSGVCYNRT